MSSSRIGRVRSISLSRVRFRPRRSRLRAPIDADEVAAGDGTSGGDVVQLAGVLEERTAVVELVQRPRYGIKRPFGTPPLRGRTLH